MGFRIKWLIPGNIFSNLTLHPRNETHEEAHAAEEGVDADLEYRRWSEVEECLERSKITHISVKLVVLRYGVLYQQPPDVRYVLKDGSEVLAEFSLS